MDSQTKNGCLWLQYGCFTLMLIPWIEKNCNYNSCLRNAVLPKSLGNVFHLTSNLMLVMPLQCEINHSMEERGMMKGFPWQLLDQQAKIPPHTNWSWNLIQKVIFLFGLMVFTIKYLQSVMSVFGLFHNFRLHQTAFPCMISRDTLYMLV